MINIIPLTHAYKPRLVVLKTEAFVGKFTRIYRPYSFNLYISTLDKLVFHSSIKFRASITNFFTVFSLIPFTNFFEILCSFWAMRFKELYDKLLIIYVEIYKRFLFIRFEAVFQLAIRQHFINTIELIIDISKVL